MSQLIETIDHELAGLGWRLWSTLGVAGDSPQHQNCLISLEELVILTAIISESHPRLRDEALDWCSRFHYFVSVSRLRTLIKELGADAHVPFSIFAETLNSISQSKWPTFTKRTPLSIVCSGKSQPPNCKIPALLGLRLRALFGLCARADLVTFFLTQRASIFTAADMVGIGYNKRTLADALDSFIQSGLLTYSIVRNQKKYELSRREQLLNLAGELPTIVPDWRKILTVLVSLRTVLWKHQDHSISSKIVAARNTLAHLSDQLHELNISPPQLSSDHALYWDSFVRWVGDTVKALVARGDFRETSTVANPLEQSVAALMQNLYKVDDCVDGLEFIVSCAREHTAKHQKIFKECYQISICYLNELKAVLEDLTKFPIHLLMDVRLSEMMFRYSKEDCQLFLDFVAKYPSSNNVTNIGIASHWYKNLEKELNKIHRFIYEIKERLKELYARQTNLHLLTQSVVLYKRHAVLSLFEILSSSPEK